MKTIKYILFIIFILYYSGAYLFSASFEDIGSVRARGMGDAFESVSSGADSIHYNPAGTAYLNKFQFFGEFGLPAINFDDDSSFSTMHSGIAVPFSQKPYLVWLNYIFKGLTLGNEEKVIQDGAFAFTFHRFSVSDFAHENLFTVNLGKSLNDLFEGANMAAGINLNIFNHGYEMTEDMAVHPEAPADSATGVGIDLGITYDFSKFIRLSFVIANLMEPNISFYPGGEEYVNQQIKGGLAYQLGDIVFMKNFLASVGLVQISRDSEDIRRPETIYKAGFEFWQMQDKLGFRMGYKTEMNTFTSGLTFKQRVKQANNFLFNYAFNYPLNTGNIKNYFSISYEFDFPDYYFDYRTSSDIEEYNARVKNNFDNGLVTVKYRTLPNDNLFNISLIHYGSPAQTEIIKKFNKIEDEENLPKEMEIPYQAKDFVLHQVVEGDTLDSISQKYYGNTDKADMIRKFNEIHFSKLRTGILLVVPTTLKNDIRTRKE